MQLVYCISLRLYLLAILLASLFNHKARLWLRGRRNLFEEIESALKPNEKRIWIHAASLGEFEQGRPVMEAIRKEMPEIKIVLTFYSPSGYEIRKNYPGADYVFYLPLDIRSNNARFLRLIRPSAVVFIKYEFWYNMLAALNKRKIPFVLISGIFRPGQLFFRWYGKWFLFRLKMFTKFFVQDQQSVNLLASAGITEVVQCGDTRIDRVTAICKEALSIEKAEVFSEGAKVLVAGSTWSPDEEILCRYLNNCPENLKAIVAPHMVDPDHIDQIRKKLKVPVAVFSSANLAELANVRVLIIDNVGMLSSLYKYASFAYIGGGFGKSIHNILEPATFGIPVIFGPRHEKFREAKDLIQTGAAFSVQDYDGFEKLVTILMSDESERKKAGNAAGAYIESNTGATEVVLKELKKILSSEYSA